MNWRVGSPRPVNKSAGARPIIDESNSIVALVLLGSREKDANVEFVVRAPRIAKALQEALAELGESHPASQRILDAIGDSILQRLESDTAQHGSVVGSRES